MDICYYVVINNSLEFELFQSIALSLGFTWFRLSNILNYAHLVDGVVYLNDDIMFPFKLKCDKDNEIIFSNSLLFDHLDNTVSFDEFIGLVEKKINE